MRVFSVPALIARARIESHSQRESVAGCWVPCPMSGNAPFLGRANMSGLPWFPVSAGILRSDRQAVRYSEDKQHPIHDLDFEAAINRLTIDPDEISWLIPQEKIECSMTISLDCSPSQLQCLDSCTQTQILLSRV